MKIKHKLLLINSNTTELKTYAQFFNKHNFEVLISNSLSQGLQIANSKNPLITIIIFNNGDEINLLNDFNNYNGYIILHKTHASDVKLKNTDTIIDGLELSENDFYNLCQKHIKKLPNEINTHSPQNLKTLLIEDSKINQLYFGEILNRLNLNHTVCDGMSDALSKIKTNEYNLIITDVNLKDGNGIDLLKQVNLIKKHKTPSIIISGHNKEELIETYGEINGDYILTKPINDVLFEETIYKCLNIKLQHSNEEPSYNYDQIIKILKNDPIKINKSLLEFIEVLNKSITFTESALKTTDYESLRASHHELLNLCSYYGAKLLSDLVLQFKAETNLENKKAILLKLHDEQKQVFKFYSKL